MLIEKFIKKIVYIGLSSIEIVKLKFYKKIVNIITLFILFFFFLILLCFMLLFIGIGFSLLIGNYLKNSNLGFVIVGLIYGIVAIVIFMLSKHKFHNYIKSKISNYLLD
jgi:hypothetical protein